MKNLILVLSLLFVGCASQAAMSGDYLEPVALKTVRLKGAGIQRFYVLDYAHKNCFYEARNNGSVHSILMSEYECEHLLRHYSELFNKETE